MFRGDPVDCLAHFCFRYTFLGSHCVFDTFLPKERLKKHPKGKLSFWGTPQAGKGKARMSAGILSPIWGGVVSFGFLKAT